MATLNITVTAGGNTVGRAKTISGADILRFIAAYRALLGQVPDGDGHRDRTDEEVVQAWADYVVQAAKTEIRRYEERQSAATAVAAIADIVVT